MGGVSRTGVLAFGTTAELAPCLHFLAKTFVAPLVFACLD